MIMTKSIAESTHTHEHFDNFYIFYVQQRIKTQKLNKKLNRITWPVIFNEICIKDGLLPKYKSIFR